MPKEMKHCFIHSLMMSKLYTFEQIEYIESQINTNINLFSAMNLKDLKGLGRYCITYVEDEKKTRTIHYNED